MITLVKKNDRSELAIMIAESETDWKSIDFMYHRGIVFGAFMLYNFKEDKNRTTDIAKFLLTRHPLCYGCLQINVVENFAAKKEPELGVR